MALKLRAVSWKEMATKAARLRNKKLEESAEVDVVVVAVGVVVANNC